MPSRQEQLLKEQGEKMSTKEKQFTDRLFKSKGKVVKAFKNEFDEKFVVYKYEGMTAYLITGDEFDWEMGWMLQKGDMNEAICIFQFHGTEKQELTKMWDHEFTKEKELYESTHRTRKNTPTELADTTKPEEFSKKS
jgi:hypothetical protein